MFRVLSTNSVSGFVWVRLFMDAIGIEQTSKKHFRLDFSRAENSTSVSFRRSFTITLPRCFIYLVFYRFSRMDRTQSITKIHNQSIDSNFSTPHYLCVTGTSRRFKLFIFSIYNFRFVAHKNGINNKCVFGVQLCESNWDNSFVSSTSMRFPDSTDWTFVLLIFWVYKCSFLHRFLLWEMRNIHNGCGWMSKLITC